MTFKETIQKICSQKQAEKGQALVMGAGIICCLVIAFLFYLSVQRAYNLANFLDETAEMAAQSAAEPIADDIVQGQVRVDATEAQNKAVATVAFLAESVAGEIDPTTIIETVTTVNPGQTNTDLCPNYSLTGADVCDFPLVAVDLELPHRLFGVPFTIRSRGVATLGANSRQPEAVPVTLPTPTNLPSNPTIVVTVNP
ncbi:MAG: hypothetical protein AAGD96_01590 [Chloroflexota bacterium]